MWAAKNRFSEPGIHRISDTGVLLIIPWLDISKVDGQMARNHFYIFVETCISLRNGLPPDNFARGEAHNHVNV